MKTKVLTAIIIISGLLLHSNNLLACPSPTAYFDVSASTISVGDSVTLDASSSSPPSPWIINQYKWNYDYANDPNNWEVDTNIITHTYLTPGTYTVALKVRNNANKESTISQREVVVTPYITVCGDIDTNTTWTADKTYYVACMSRISAGVTLTIEPGTVVKFNTGTGLGPGYGHLIAEGTPDSYIIFTSKYDCTVGETVDSSRSPQMHDWRGISTRRGNDISFCKISYADNGISVADTTSDSTSLSFQHNMINTCGTGIMTYNLLGTGSTLNIFNNLVSNCGYGIACEIDNETANLNIFNNTVVDCAYDAMLLLNETEEVDIYNNLISGCDRGIIGGQGPSPHCNYNAFFDTTPEFVYVDPDHQGTDNVYLDSSPFDSSCFLGPYILNDNTNGGYLLQNAGNPSSPDMLGFTAQCYKISDEAPVDIGFHYPSDYDGHGRGIICGSTIFSPDSVFSGGYHHSLYIKSDTTRTVWASGSNTWGRAGLGEGRFGTATQEQVLQGDKNYPEDDAYLEGIIFVDAGNLHSLAVGSDGSAWAWGFNVWGQIGVTGDSDFGDYGLATIHWEPVQVRDQSGTGYLSNIKKVSTGNNEASEYSLALDNNDNVWAWGRNSYSVCDDPDPACTEYGQLGIGSNDDYRIVPVLVSSIGNITDVSAGITHSIACGGEEGNVWTWGYNKSGELGNGTTGGYSTVPVKVLCGQMNTQSGYLENIVAVAASGTQYPVDNSTNTSYALDKDGNVWAWGYGFFGKLGDNAESRGYDDYCIPYWHSATPIKVKCGEMNTASGYLENIVAISAGAQHVLALDKFGRVWAWGNSGSLVGNGGIGDCICEIGDCVYSPCDCDVYNSQPLGVTTPDRVRKYVGDNCEEGYLSDIVAIDAGGYHSMAIDRSGTVWAWGANYLNQFGSFFQPPCSGNEAYKAVSISSWSFCP